MSVTARALESRPPDRSADMRLAVLATATVLFSMTAFLAGLFGVLPVGYSTAIVMFGMAVALKVAWTYMARAATLASRARMALLLSNAGLALSAVAAIAALPRLTQASGLQLLLVDLCAQRRTSPRPWPRRTAG